MFYNEQLAFELLVIPELNIVHKLSGFENIAVKKNADEFFLPRIC